MSLNPNAMVFEPRSNASNPQAQSSGTSDSPKSQHSSVSPLKTSNRKQKYNVYLEKRRSAVHTTIRAGYESALVYSSDEYNVNDENVKDKLIVDLVRLLAGLGWMQAKARNADVGKSTSVVLRAAAELEMDQSLDALACLRHAQKRKDEFHDRRTNDQPGKDLHDRNDLTKSTQIDVTIHSNPMQHSASLV